MNLFYRLRYWWKYERRGVKRVTPPPTSESCHSVRQVGAYERTYTFTFPMEPTQ